MKYPVKVLAIHLIPSPLDYKRASNFEYKSDKQQYAQVKAIKDPEKALTRSVAISLESLFGTPSICDDFRNKAVELNVNENVLRLYDDTIKYIVAEKHRLCDEARQRQRNAELAKLRPGLIHPSEIVTHRSTSVKLKNKTGEINIHHRMSNFWCYTVEFTYHTKTGREKTIHLGTTYAASYDIDYTKFIVNLINNNKIKSY